MEGCLQGKVALVTGGSSGIGQAAALAFAREGAKVIVAARNMERLKETVGMIQAAGGEAEYVQTDVTQASQVEAMVKGTVKSYGQLDCAFNNAGGRASNHGESCKVVDWTEADWDSIVELNLKSVWLCMKYEIPQMLKVGGGAIVNTSSIVGLRGLEFRAPYVAAKHGVVGLTRAAALEYAEEGIRVNALCPGAIRTPAVERLLAANPDSESQVIAQEPVGRFGTPEEVAEAVIWLCSGAASFVTGHALVVDGGMLA